MPRRASILAMLPLPIGRTAAFFDAELKVELVETATGFALDIETDRFIQSLQIKAEGCLPCDNWFHLARGRCGASC